MPKLIKINDKDIYTIILYDTPGSESYRYSLKPYFKNVDGILLLFDLSNKSSFDGVNNWMDTIKELSKENNRKEDDIIIYLIGNKLDLVEKDNEVIDEMAIKDLAEKLGIKYYEISCKWNLNIEEVMARIILECFKNIKIK